MSDENRTEGTDDDRGDDAPGHTGHDKYRPVNLQSDRSDPRRNRRTRRGDTASGESESVGRNATRRRRVGTTGTARGARRYGQERHTGNRHERGVGGDDGHRVASDRYRSGQSGRPSDRRHYDSRGHRSSDRSGPTDDQASLGNRYAGDRDRSNWDRRYGSRRGSSVREDTRRE